MNQQISPWSIYDHRIQPHFSKPRRSKQDSNFSKKASSFFQKSALSTNPEDLDSQKITKTHHYLQDQLDRLQILKFLHQQLKSQQDTSFSLPKIKHHPPLIKECMQMGRGFQSVIKSKSSKKTLSFEQEIHQLSSKRNELTIMNLQPFSEQDIIRRGLIQLLKIQQRKRMAKKRSKANIK